MIPKIMTGYQICHHLAISHGSHPKNELGAFEFLQNVDLLIQL